MSKRPDPDLSCNSKPFGFIYSKGQIALENLLRRVRGEVEKIEARVRYGQAGLRGKGRRRRKGEREMIGAHEKWVQG